MSQRNKSLGLRCIKCHAKALSGQSKCRHCGNAVRNVAMRPIPEQARGKRKLLVCRQMNNEGRCHYGTACTFAHSDDELAFWMSENARISGSSFATTAPVGPPRTGAVRASAPVPAAAASPPPAAAAPPPAHAAASAASGVADERERTRHNLIESLRTEIEARSEFLGRFERRNVKPQWEGSSLIVEYPDLELRTSHILKIDTQALITFYNYQGKVEVPVIIAMIECGPPGRIFLKAPNGAPFANMTSFDITFPQSDNCSIMVEALERVSMQLLFPPGAGMWGQPSHEPTWEDRELNDDQKKVVKAITNPKHILPKEMVVLLGAFGTGKTRTILECVRQCYKKADSKILLVSQSNSCANGYTEDLKSLQPARLYWEHRNPSTIPKSIREFAKFTCPSPSQRLVITTCMTAHQLWALGSHFDFVFVDEAAQALEGEVAVALVPTGEKTRVLLAGDHLQLAPAWYSENPPVSYLERVMLDGMCKVQKSVLNRVYRSRPAITHMLSKLFYNDLLKPAQSHDKLKFAPFMHVDIDGVEEVVDGECYNEPESAVVVQVVQRLLEGKTFSRSDVAVIGCSKKHIQVLRRDLRKQNLGEINVIDVDSSQSMEFRVVVMSTARTRPQPKSLTSRDFCANPASVNTAMSRACDLLIVVGSSATLQDPRNGTVELWRTFLQDCKHAKTLVTLASFPFGSGKSTKGQPVPAKSSKSETKGAPSSVLPPVGGGNSARSSQNDSVSAIGSGALPATSTPAVPSAATHSPAPISRAPQQPTNAASTAAMGAPGMGLGVNPGMWNAPASSAPASSIWGNGSAMPQPGMQPQHAFAGYPQPQMGQAGFAQADVQAQVQVLQLLQMNIDASTQALAMVPGLQYYNEMMQSLQYQRALLQRIVQGLMTPRQ
eukprot:m.22100 g.22100  ORF g.22100 m.22100 type:complete len:893 (-) comp3982_c0_seq1:20-2698(-)